VLSVFALAFFGTSPFAAVQAGALAEALGPAWAVGIGAGVTLAYGAAVCVAVPAIRRLEG
jgi:hypothetical protein